MLASRFRLPGYLIPEVKEKGKFYRFSSFALLVLKKPGEKPSRFAAILSLKFNKKAVVRNQVKRKLFEAVRLQTAELKPGFLVIFLPRKVLIEKNREKINQEVKEAFERIKITG